MGMPAKPRSCTFVDPETGEKCHGKHKGHNLCATHLKRSKAADVDTSRGPEAIAARRDISPAERGQRGAVSTSAIAAWPSLYDPDAGIARLRALLAEYYDGEE